jgi:hypothetical protein
MAISQVGGSTATSVSTAVLTLTVTYSPTLGNTIVLFLGANGALTALTVQDNLGNNLVAGPTANLGAGKALSFYYLTVPSGVTGYTATWTTTARVASITIEEYSGVTNGVNVSLVGNTTTGSTSPASLTATIDEANDWLIVGILTAGSNVTGTVGNSRQSITTGTVRQLLMDNTQPNVVAVTCTGTLGAVSWACLAIELRVPAIVISTLFTPPTISSEFHWGGGDGW